MDVQELSAEEVQGMTDELRELRAEIAAYKRAFREIERLCNASHWTAERRWKIRDRCNKELGTPHGEVSGKA